MQLLATCLYLQVDAMSSREKFVVDWLQREMETMTEEQRLRLEAGEGKLAPPAATTVIIHTHNTFTCVHNFTHAYNGAIFKMIDQ